MYVAAQSSSLAIKLDRVRLGITAPQGQRIISPVATALSIAALSFEREPIWVVAAADFIGGASACFLHDALNSWVEAFTVFLIIIYRASANKNLQNVGDKRAFNNASSNSAVIARVGVGALLVHQEGGGPADAGIVLDLPRDASGALFFGVTHGALVAIVEDFTNFVQSVNWLSFTSPVVIAKVAPAPVLV